MAASLSLQLQALSGWRGVVLGLGISYCFSIIVVYSIISGLDMCGIWALAIEKLSKS